MKAQLSNAVNSRHPQIILLSRGGVCNREISERVRITPQWVREIIHRFNDGGIDAITWFPYFCGRTGPRRFAAEVVEQIGEVALSPPPQLIGMSVWSLAKLRGYLMEQGIVTIVKRVRQLARPLVDVDDVRRHPTPDRLQALDSTRFPPVPTSCHPLLGAQLRDAGTRVAEARV